MHSQVRFLLCSLLIIECVLFRTNIVSAQNDSEELDDSGEESSLQSIKPVEDTARFNFPAPEDGSNFYVKSVKTAIKTTSKFFKGCKPLIFFTALDETFLINRTERSVDVKILNPVTVATMTGGILGDDIYELHRYQFFWQNNLKCNATHNLEARVYYFNLKYESYEKALDNPDGIVVVNLPIATNRDSPNPKFIEFSKTFQKKIKCAGDSTKIHSAFAYTWFVNFPLSSIYHTSKIEFEDTEFGKTCQHALVIDLPLESHVNYISNEQYQNTFGSMKGISEQSLIADLFQSNPVTSMERHKGICVVNLPA